MSTRKDGGPAFPVSRRKTENYMDQGGYGRTRVVTVDDGGMSLRDYFAAAALQGYLASYAGCTQIIDSEKAAEQCYRYADAMLEARKK